MTPLRRYQGLTANSKTTKEKILYSAQKLHHPKYRNSTQLPVKWQKSIKQKECGPTKVLCKCSSFSFPYKKAQIEEFAIP